ncbi:unnamed protein product [Auanema sp. JU1783]|nr:unnamed protein product [Auanema sp. JU1783]
MTRIIIAALFLLRSTQSEDLYDNEYRVPDAPEDVRVRTTSTTATLWWEPPSDASVLVRGYTVAYGIGAPSRRIVIEGAETNSFTVTRLQPNTSYVFAVGAYNEAEGEDGERVLVSATTLPGDKNEEALWPPTAVRAYVTGPGTVQVEWQDPNPDDSSSNSVLNAGQFRHYLIHYGIYQSQHMKKMRSNSRSVKLTGLTSGKEYEIAVKVVGADGRESPWRIRDIVLLPTDPAESISRYDWFCDFEKDLCGMEIGDGIPWSRTQLRIGSGNFSVVIDPMRGNDYHATLLSPLFRLQNSAALCLQFKYFMKQAQDASASLHIGLRNDKKGSQRSVLRIPATQLPTDTWSEITIPIRQQKHPFKIFFELSWKEEGPWLSLDNIQLSSGFCPTHENSIKFNDNAGQSF